MPARLMGIHEAGRGKLPACSLGGAVLTLFLEEGWRGGRMGVAAPEENDDIVDFLVPLTSPTPRNSSRSACEAAVGCCALDWAA